MRHFHLISSMVIIAISVIFGPASLRAESLSELALFHRCYSQLTGLRAKATNPLALEVTRGEKSAIDACLSLLAKANLDPATGYVANASSPDPEALAVINTFYHFHRLWFEETTFDNQPDGHNNRGEIRYLDTTEPSLFLTRLLLTDAPYSEAANGNYGVRGLRSQGSMIMPPTGNTFQRMDPNEDVPVAHPRAGLERGILKGIYKYKPEENDVWWNEVGTPLKNLFATVLTDAVTNSQVITPLKEQPYRSYGAGVAGLHSFITMNSGFTDFELKANGAETMQRRWAKNAMQLLCRPLPLLRAADVGGLVVAYNTKYPVEATRIPFRESTSCMRCHAAMDPIASLARNLTFYTSTVDNNGDGFVERYKDYGVMLRDRAPTKPQETEPEYTLLAADKDFYLRPPRGHLRYRSFDGTKVWVDISGSSTVDAFAKLGSAWASSRDLYACAAKRYLEHFTGIDANLDYLGDPEADALSPSSLAERQIAISLGDNLKKHQSLKKLIEEIFRLDLYRQKAAR